MFKKLLITLSVITYIFCGSIEGTVSYAGSNKTAKSLKMDSDPICGTAHSVPPKKEDFILNEKNQFKNVIVWLKNVDYKDELKSDPATIDQLGCIYSPHVNVFTTAQKVFIKNSDKTLHNVNSQSKINQSFNSAQPAGVPDIEKTFTSKEDPFYIKCDVHPWMKAWVMVSDHPYFAITDENGYFKIDNIPEGTYEVGFWQEKLSNLPKKKYVISSNSSEVVVSKDATTKLDFEFQKPVKKAKK
ncbi:MAG: hypothetical protein CMG66_04005 [Candidatus Marinimicrobia bacterium]|nr:hypothetical protein [Candidatus Neomarinimicrobiota bacterium]|tara:strand:+ start:12343 stop:13071 length:729 start_codon:yes stop_codon:yes gene_type:complete